MDRGDPRCRCGQRLFYLSADGRIRLRSAVLVFKSGGPALAVCPRCKGEVPVDLLLGEDLRKSLQTPARKLVIRGFRKGLDSPDSET